MPKTLFEGRTALVTGGAKRLGKAIALGLARNGANVLVHCHRSVREAQKAAAEIRALGRSAWVVQGGLEEPAEVEALFAKAWNTSSGFDILVNSASIFPKSQLRDFSSEELTENMQVNAMSPLILGRSLAKKRRGGCIVNLLDSRMVDYDKEHAAYHLSKRVLWALTRMMALEFAPQTRVNAVAPGLILPPPGEDESYLERLKNTNPLKCHGSPQDVARAVVFLVSSPFITGQVVFVDGGRHLL